MLRDDFVYGESDHARYLEQGFQRFDRCLTDEGLARCRRAVDEILADLRPDHDPCGILSVHQRGERWLWDLATAPGILDMVERQIGPDVVLWCTHLVCKPPGHDRAIPWHQDQPYWNVTGPMAGGVWIPLDDVDEANGSMMVVPETHTAGTLPRRTSDVELFSEAIDPATVEALAARAVTYSIPAGGLATHDPMLVHSSQPNNSSRSRRVITLRYMTASGGMGENSYRDWRTGESFPRRFFLVRGEDRLGRGLERSPF